MDINRFFAYFGDSLLDPNQDIRFTPSGHGNPMAKFEIFEGTVLVFGFSSVDSNELRDVYTRIMLKVLLYY